MVKDMRYTCKFFDPDTGEELPVEADIYVKHHIGTDNVELHQTFTAASAYIIPPSVYRDLLLDFEGLKEHLKFMGIKFIVTASEDWDAKMKRYWKLFGFVPLDDYPGTAIVEVK